jgi:hypothetical protein
MSLRKRPSPICDSCGRKIQITGRKSLRWTTVHVCAHCQAAAWRVIYDRDKRIGKLPKNLSAG